jgi:hypothetical protein
MHIPAVLQEDIGELAQSVTELDTAVLLRYLLDGLERQKDELGPIADELIELLHSPDVAGSS